MKKYLLSCFLLATVLYTQAQSKKDSLSPSLQGNNEIKLNVLYAVLGSPEITYERILNEKNAIGISILVRAFETVKMDFSTAINPYFRHYFGAKKAGGFFLEAHGSILQYDGKSAGKVAYIVDSYGYSYPISIAEETYYGFGATAGSKFFTRKGYTFEIYLGASQTYSKSESYLAPRGGLTIGKRF
jgi:hypothetical protein